MNEQETRMDFLILAERYAAAYGHDVFFKWVYTNHREYNGVMDSVRKTLSHLYGDYVADTVWRDYQDNKPL